MTAESAIDDPWVLDTIDDVEEVFSDLLYMPPRAVRLRDGTQWELSVDEHKGVRFELVRPGAAPGKVEVRMMYTFEGAFERLRGARML